MFGCNRLYHVAVGGWLTAAILLGFSYPSLSDQSVPEPSAVEGKQKEGAKPPKTGPDEDTSSEHTPPGEADQERTSVKSPIQNQPLGEMGDTPKKHDGNNEAQHREARSVADLEAQQKMAWASEWLLYVSVVGTVIASVGMFLLLHNLSLAREANRLANQSLIASQRPWVSVDIGIVSSLIFTDGEGRLTLQFAMNNIGNSPAINVEVEFEIVLLPHNSWGRLIEITNKAKNRKPKRMIGHKIFPGGKFIYSNNTPIEKKNIEAATQEIGIENMLKTMIFPEIVGCIVYNSTFNDENHTTEFMVRFGKCDPTNPKILLGISTENGETPLDLLKMQLSFGTGRAD